jgi:hypothetical protein
MSCACTSPPASALRNVNGICSVLRCLRHPLFESVRERVLVEAFDLGRACFRGHDRGREGVDTDTLRPRCLSQERKRLVEGEPEALGEHAFRLLDHHPRSKRALELGVADEERFDQLLRRDGRSRPFLRRLRRIELLRHGTLACRWAA